MMLRRWLSPALLTLCMLPSAVLAQEADAQGQLVPDAAQPDVAPAKPPTTRLPDADDAPPVQQAPPADDAANKSVIGAKRPGAEPVNAADAVRSLRDNDRTFRSGPWSYRFGGYVRAAYAAIANDPQSPLFGRNDGFAVANARPYLLGAMESGLGFMLQLEVAAGLDRPSTVLPDREVLARPRDAYIFYAPHNLLRLQLGAFRPPHDAESLLPTNSMLFIRRSVGVDGVGPADGYQTPGLGFDREVGVQLSGTHFFASADQKPKGPGVSYALALTNGTDSSRTLPDNDSPAFWARAAFLWGDMVQLGAGVLYNNATLGEPPDQVGERRSGWTADLKVQVEGATLFGSYISRTATTPFGQETKGSEEPFTTANALQVQAGYLIPVVHLQPVYRFASFDPSAAFNIDTAGDFRDTDAITQHTIGLNYIAQDYPIMVMLDYTISQEQAGRELDNNRFEALVQLTW
jgi:hypothetical protein